MRFLVLSFVLLVACGRSDSSLADQANGQALADGGSSALADAGAGDAGAADAGRWCAAEAASCLADGWRFDEAGRCCNSRMTCKGLTAGTAGRCEY
ncbi:MAG: hypothetical protein JNM69_25970 [Archangium sp.]|nr:hypothetical protein [Archangium sp.]